MSVKKLQKLIDDLHYWDARVTYLNCNYFGDEVELCYEDVIYKFNGCYKVVFDHYKKDDKMMRVKDMTIPQIPYFLQDVEIGELIEEDTKFYTCKINMWPLDLEIHCKDIKVIKKIDESFYEGN